MLEGVYVANLTPFRGDDEYSIEVDAYLAHAEWLGSHGVTGVVPFGTNGEGVSVAAPEKLRVLAALFARGLPLEIVPCVAESSLPAALEMVHALDAYPARAVLVLPPYFYTPIDADGLLRFFAPLAAASRHPLVAYHIPRYGIPVPPEALARLPVWGVKDSGGDPEYARAVGETGKGLLIGTEELLWVGHGYGAAGTITGMGNYMPDLIVALHGRVRAGDEAGARELAARIRAARETEGPAWIAQRKRLAEARHGVPMGPVRPPLPPAPKGYDPAAVLALAGLAEAKVGTA